MVMLLYGRVIRTLCPSSTFMFARLTSFFSDAVKLVDLNESSVTCSETWRPRVILKTILAFTARFVKRRPMEKHWRCIFSSNEFNECKTRHTPNLFNF